MKMTKEKYQELTKAGNILCNWCENDECEKCQVQILLDEAYAEALDKELLKNERIRSCF